jgi:hypothetical protein
MPCFHIHLHAKDSPLLSGIQLFFGVGGISLSKDSALYHVSSVKDLTSVIIPHFMKYPLLTQKCADFQLFKMAIELINKKEHLTLEGLAKIWGIAASINRGLSEELVKSFPNINPVERPMIELSEILNPNWLGGFTSGEGCFAVEISNSKTHKTGSQVQLRFSISQHSRDTELMTSLVKYLNCGMVKERSNLDIVEFVVTKFADIEEKI